MSHKKNLRKLKLAMGFNHGLSIKSYSVLVFGCFWVARAAIPRWIFADAAMSIVESRIVILDCQKGLKL